MQRKFVFSSFIMKKLTREINMLIIPNLKKFLILLVIFSIPYISWALPDEIDIRDTGISKKFINNDNNIIESHGYRNEFISKVGVHHAITKWETFKQNLDSNQKRGIAGEVAAKFFFEDLGYKILEEHYERHISLLETYPRNEDIKNTASCTTKKGPDNGIDGIFILKNEDFSNPSHIVINEAKFRNRDHLSTNDFGFVMGGIQQSHSKWNEGRFNWPTCLHLNYKEQAIIRTATLLDQNGNLKLYEVKDRGQVNDIVRDFPSNTPKRYSQRIAYDLFFITQIGKNL